MNQTNNFSARESFAIAKQLLFDSFFPNFLAANKGDVMAATQATQKYVDQLKLSQNSIRMEVELNTTNSIFTFAPTVQQQNSTNFLFNTELRLDQQDTLVASNYRIYVAKPGSRTDTEYPVCTYGNTQVFTAAAAAAIDNCFYANGVFQLRCNNDVIIPGRLMINHLYRPQTQQTAALGAGSPGDQFRGAEDAIITQEPNLLVIGPKKYVPQIVLPAALSTVDEFTRAILIYDGVLAQNSTVTS